MSDLDRRTGRTTRMLWKVLTNASETKGTYLVVAATHAHARWIAQLLRDLLAPVGGCVFARNTATLPNGSIVECVDSSKDRLTGRRQMVVVDDHFTIEAAIARSTADGEP